MEIKLLSEVLSMLDIIEHNDHSGINQVKSITIVKNLVLCNNLQSPQKASHGQLDVMPETVVK